MEENASEGTSEVGEREAEPKYRMTVSLNVLHHLGIGLYSNVPAVLSELVANAWDADANEVEVSIDPSGHIVVADDGHGMTLDDINERFLKVGYRRRLKSAISPGGRAVMGRKGIGKLSSFSIANIVEVHSFREAECNALRMNRTDIEEQIKDENSGEYHPVDVDPQMNGLDHGTRIVLRELDKSVSRTAPYLRRRLARRFSIIGPRNGFKVSVNDEEITSKDRDFYNKLEFLWSFGKPTDAAKVGGLKKRSELNSTVTVPSEDGEEAETHEVWGWIGTVDRPDSLDDVNNSIVLLARGKLVHENLLPEFKEAGMYAQYVVGEINADFLDGEGKDIVTSDRQSVKEEDSRYRALCGYVQGILKTIKNEWTALRVEEGTKRALTYPSVEKWYKRLGPDGQKTAKRLFGRIESLMLPDIETKKELYRSTMLAFEKLALRDMLSVLESIESQAEFETLARVIAGVEEVEAFHYHEVALGRLKVIERFRGLVDDDVLEKVLQKLIFKELWLLHPSWERAASNTRIEETVRKEFDDIDAKLSEDERKGRIDIRYKTAAGKHIIIELKKADRAVNAEDLISQLRKYRNALAKCLATKFPQEPTQIEMIAILGSPPRPLENEQENRNLLAAIQARYITYDQLVLEAERSYAEYLEKDKKISELVEIIDGLDADFAQELKEG